LWTTHGGDFFSFLSFPFLLKFKHKRFEEDSRQGQMNSTQNFKLCLLYI
jgi:hypothetical protein